jgi:segregation and condensation protein B
MPASTDLLNSTRPVPATEAPIETGDPAEAAPAEYPTEAAPAEAAPEAGSVAEDPIETEDPAETAIGAEAEPGVAAEAVTEVALETEASTEAASEAGATQPELLETGSLQRSIEALLFVASESLSIERLAKLTRASHVEVAATLAKIEADFAERGIVVREIAGGYRFASSPASRDVVEAYLLPPKTNLSPAATETLAIVAYMQPVTKGEIEGVRGVNVDSVVSTLLDRRFIVEAGRRDTPGRPMTYKTTQEFLESFGLRSLRELPNVDLEAELPMALSLPLPEAGPAAAKTVSDEA